MTILIALLIMLAAVPFARPADRSRRSF